MNQLMVNQFALSSHFLYLIPVPAVFGNPLPSSQRHRHGRHDITGLLSPSHDACVDPNPDVVGPADGTNGQIPDLARYLEHIKDDTLDLREKLEDGKRHIEQRTHCQNIVDDMRELNITDFVTIETAIGEYDESETTQMYFQLRRLLYLFEILQSDRLEPCCLHTSRFFDIYDRLSNRVLGKWLTLNARYGQPIQEAHCCMRGAVELNRRHVPCEIIRDLTYTVLGDGIATVTRSITFLQNWISDERH